MPFQIVRNDLTKMHVDAIVNTANPMPGYGAGIDSAIYEAAGKDNLLAKRHEIGAIDRGTSVITDGYQLPAKYIIHTVGTAWQGGKEGEEDIIRSCYRSVFKVASKNDISSLAIPLLASGSYGFPKGIALRIALSEIEAFMSVSDMDVYLVVFDEKSVSLSSELYGDIDEYINDNYVDEKNKKAESIEAAFEDEEEMLSSDMCLSAPILEEKRSLDDVVNNLDKTFMELVFSFADAKGLTDVEVQKDYYVRGCTALLDAVGGAIHHIGNVHKYAREEDRPAKTLFVITTDGLENSIESANKSANSEEKSANKSANSSDNSDNDTENLSINAIIIIE